MRNSPERDAALVDWRDITPLYDDEPIWNYSAFVYYVDPNAVVWSESNQDWQEYGYKHSRTPIRVYANRLLMLGKIT